MLFIKFTKKTLILLFYLSALLVVTGCVSKPTHFGVIFTINDIDSPIDIYRIPDNTKGKVEQLTFTPTIGEYGLLVSPNGDRIIFRTDHYTSLEVEPFDLAIEKSRHLYHLDTANKQLIDITNVVEDKFTQVGPDFFMDWSPDQQQFVVITHQGGGDEFESFLQFMDFDGKNRKEILIPKTGEIPSLIYTARWSPDGKKVALTQLAIGVKAQAENPGSPILIFDLVSGKLTQISDYKDNCLAIEWSPTSQQIVTTCSASTQFGKELSYSPTVRIFDVENPSQNKHSAYNSCSDPSWSPDGKQIAFVCDKGGDQVGLFIANPDGGRMHEVKLGDLDNSAILKDPTWSPDGRQIVYVIGSDYEHTNIYSVYTNGSNNFPLTNQDAYYSIVTVYPIQ